jgi:drug/metabolite transporter (DMT)-like permease
MSSPSLAARLGARFAAGPWRYWTLLVAAGISWGSTVVMAKVATAGGHHPLGLALWQALILVLLLGGRQLVVRTRLPLSPRHLVFYAVCGLLGAAVPHTASFYAARELPAGVLAIVLATSPIMTAAIAMALRTERASALRVAGLLLGLSGIVLLVAPEASLPGSGASLWILVAAVAPLSFASEDNVIDRRMPKDCDALSALLGFSIAASVMLLPVVWASGTNLDLWRPWGLAEGAIVLMAVAHLFAYGTLIWLIGRAGPVFASQIGYVTTLSGVAWGMLLLGERHSAWVWAALALLLLGITLVKPRDDTAG